MEHKAFLFDFNAFRRELMPLLNDALSTGQLGPLEDFVQQHRADMCQPASGEPLADDWRGTVEDWDAHQIGDIALTKYYDPLDDRGLGTDWEHLQRQLLEEVRTDLPLLGVPVGPAEEPFDPGKMGSYFQSPEEVAAHLALLQRFTGSGELSGILRSALEAGTGLYVTF